MVTSKGNGSMVPETQIVKSYVRYKQTQVTQEKTESKLGENEIMAVVVGSAVVLLFAIVYWTVSLPLVLIVGGLWGFKKLKVVRTVQEVKTAPAALEQPKTKRHYQKRIKVHDWQTGKVVRV